MLVPVLLLLLTSPACLRTDHVRPLDHTATTKPQRNHKPATTLRSHQDTPTRRDHNATVQDDPYFLYGDLRSAQTVKDLEIYYDSKQKDSLANVTNLYRPDFYTRNLRYDSYKKYVKHLYGRRHKRESHPLISTFDISRMFKKKKLKTKETTSDSVLLPSVASLKSDRIVNEAGKLEEPKKTITVSDTILASNDSVANIDIKTAGSKDKVLPSATKSPKAIPTIPTEMTLVKNTEIPTTINVIGRVSSTSKPKLNGTKQLKKTRKGKVRQAKGSGLTKPGKSLEPQAVIKVKPDIALEDSDTPPTKDLTTLVTTDPNRERDLQHFQAKSTKPLELPVNDSATVKPKQDTKQVTKPTLDPEQLVIEPTLDPEQKVTKSKSSPEQLMMKPTEPGKQVVKPTTGPEVMKATSSPEQLVVSPAVKTLKPRVMVKKNETAWPVKHAAVVEGDIVLGGLMMVHRRSEGATCGPVMAQGGVQALEAMLFALDQCAPLAPPRVALGAHVLDDCDNDTYGLEMALDFIKGSISNIDDAEYACNATALRKVISGVVGAASSVTSVQVANLLRLFKIPQVSFFSTSPELSNKARFEYFTRTIPSDLHQVRAMVEIVKQLGWKYVSIIYEESNYGIKAFEELETLLARNGVCIAVKERLVKDSGEADATAYDAIVAHLLSRPRARGVIVFGSDQEVAGVMQAVIRARATNSFRWVGSDGWSARALVSEGNEAAVEGTISVQPQANEVKGFKEYFLQLTVENNPRNPWFVEFWEDHFHCRYPGSPRTPYNNYNTTCTGKERLTAQNTEFEAQLQFVADAVMAFAHAIRDMHNDLCGGKPGLCEAMQPASGPQLLRYLRKVNFTGLTGDKFHFDGNGDGPARYNILHFKQVSRGVYRWLKVGQYLDGKLELDMEEVQFKWGERQPPESVCSAECELGQAKQYVEGESCCWHCFNCTQYEVRSPEVETVCIECPRGTLPDASRTRCADIPEVYLRPNSAWAIGAMTFSSLGIILTTFVVSVWGARGDTPVVRASGRELSFVLLAGIMMCYLVTFALVFRPTDILCSLQRFGTGFCFTVVYAALLTKTNRIARIFDASKQSAKRPSLISPKSQLVICTILVSIQVVIVVVWQIVSPARAVHHYPTREDNMLVCDSYVDASYTIAFFYPVLLILVCTVYAVLTRKIPEAFNESKHIGFTMYTTCVIWLAFVPLYFGTASHVPLRVTSMAVTISLSASVTLVCLFAPKLYIILVRPERNVRAQLTAAKWARGGRGAAGGAVCAALVGAAPLPRAPDPTPSTDRSTLGDTDKTTLSDKYIQTDDVTANHRKATNGDLNLPNRDENPLPLNPSRLSDIGAGLPGFDSKRYEGKKLLNGPLGVTVLGAEIPL